MRSTLSKLTFKPSNDLLSVKRVKENTGERVRHQHEVYNGIIEAITNSECIVIQLVRLSNGTAHAALRNNVIGQQNDREN